VHGLLIDPLKNSQRGPKVIRTQGTYPFDGMKFDVFRLACSGCRTVSSMKRAIHWYEPPGVAFDQSQGLLPTSGWQGRREKWSLFISWRPGLPLACILEREWSSKSVAKDGEVKGASYAESVETFQGRDDLAAQRPNPVI
jgi:hypothetical protein